MSKQYKAQTFIDAIPGTGGIVSAIARRVGCTWGTAQKYVTEFPTVKAAFDDECESTLDLAESIVRQNMILAQMLQRPTKDDATGKDVYPDPVDSSDAKWYLSKRGKKRGYGDSLEVGGKGGGPVIIKVVYDENPGSASTEAAPETG